MTINEKFPPRKNFKWANYPGKVGAGIAESDFGTAPAVAQELHSAIDDGYTGYTPDHVYRDHLSTYADFLRGRYEWKVDEFAIRLADDVQSAYEAVIRHFTRHGSYVIVPTPAYAPFTRIPERLGRNVVEVPMLRRESQYSLDLDAISQAFERGGELLVLCNPHNPTGTVLGTDQLLALSEVISHYNGAVFADEVWAPIVYSGKHVPYASVSDTTEAHTITASSPSKGWNLSGLKCAQIVLSNPRDQKRWDDLALFPPSANSILGVIGATAAYGSGAEWLDDTVARLAVNRNLLARLLEDRLPGVWPTTPSATYLAWLDFTGWGRGSSPGAALDERAKVIVNHGEDYGVDWREFVRFNYAMCEIRLSQAVDSIATAFGR
ncbi:MULTISPECIES: MalY/PatB family protein [Rhodococcus]|uniref:cysteine-S-conjugate beta-lyase n=1 Tax=Rhodococcus wratislaviensis NBRC 100605 TaxID=1219028 RepID=X0PVA2_RHOWR|nr:MULTISPECIES: aminotransferase class I/II-fold pyridoxal phosphate-dependent enzyme [Rhodococcus]WAM19121.1 aminotransferase class I/II-fold pyridoxal phosphate-dependent enzyme [Rhodococcus sp. JS3073]GAF47128.1 putative aminotransferase [Rhodococcus wratislaviensis NBRC 100605]